MVAYRPSRSVPKAKLHRINGLWPTTLSGRWCHPCPDVISRIKVFAYCIGKSHP